MHAHHTSQTWYVLCTMHTTHTTTTTTPVADSGFDLEPYHAIPRCHFAIRSGKMEFLTPKTPLISLALWFVSFYVIHINEFLLCIMFMYIDLTRKFTRTCVFKKGCKGNEPANLKYTHYFFLSRSSVSWDSRLSGLSCVLWVGCCRKQYWG